MSSQKIRDLRGLGAKSEASLAKVGIHTVDDLKARGAVRAYLSVCQHAQAQGHARPSMNFLYALVGGLTERSWLEVAQTEKTHLLADLDALERLDM